MNVCFVHLFDKCFRSNYVSSKYISESISEIRFYYSSQLLSSWTKKTYFLYVQIWHCIMWMDKGILWQFYKSLKHYNHFS